MSISESTIYTHSRLSKIETHWGSLKLFFTSSKRSLKLLCCLLVGIPIWYVAGILSYFAPEFAKAFHIQGEVTAGTCIMVGYLGAILGDIACGFLSHFLKSRKKAVLIFLSLGGFIALTHGLWIENGSAAIFYSTRFAIGFGNGYIAVLVAWIAEIFGTNLRATTTTLVPNLIRAAVIPLIFVLNKLVPHFGLLHSSIIIGVSCFSAAIIASFFLEETFHRDINFIEN